MIQITPQAVQHLLHLRKERGFRDADGARFVRNAGRLGVTFTPAPENGDRVVDAGGMSLFVAPDIADRLDQSVVDARREDGRTLLVARPRRGFGSS
jgi:Fe-S cluster assembly iron-binding protein IscA